MARLSKTELKPLNRAKVALNIQSDPLPLLSTVIREAGITEEEALVCLRCSTAPEALSMIAAYDLLTGPERKAITIDHLVMVAKDGEGKAALPAHILSLLVEQLFQQKTAVASLIAALNSPNVMKAAVFYSGLVEGHQDRKMLLQSTGNAPVPKNQQTYVNISGNKIDKSVHISAAPTLESVLNEVDNVIDAEVG